MRNIKIVLFTLTFFALLLQIFAMMLPSHIIISRAIDCKAKPAQIAENISNFNQWKQWSKSFATTPNLTISSNGQKAESGPVAMEILNQSDTNCAIKLKQGNQDIFSNIKIIPNDTLTTVQWQYEMHLKWYAWEKFKAVFADNMYGPLLDSNLTALKIKVEALK